MAACTARRIDEVYCSDQRTSIPVLELMGGPADIDCPTYWIHPEQKFRELADQWRKETQHHSSLDKIFGNEAYQEIIALGWPVVPLLLKELAGPDPDQWGLALAEITGEQPVPDDANGRIEVFAREWLAWGRGKGFIV